MLRQIKKEPEIDLTSLLANIAKYEGLLIALEKTKNPQHKLKMEIVRRELEGLKILLAKTFPEQVPNAAQAAEKKVLSGSLDKVQEPPLYAQVTQQGCVTMMQFQITLPSDHSIFKFFSEPKIPAPDYSRYETMIKNCQEKKRLKQQEMEKISQQWQALNACAADTQNTGEEIIALQAKKKLLSKSYAQLHQDLEDIKAMAEGAMKILSETKAHFRCGM